MKVTKQLTINIGGYQSLKIGAEDAPSFEDCDTAIIAELERLDIPVNNKIKQCLNWEQKGLGAWM